MAVVCCLLEDAFVRGKTQAGKPGEFCGSARLGPGHAATRRVARTGQGNMCLTFLASLRDAGFMHRFSGGLRLAASTSGYRLPSLRDAIRGRSCRRGIWSFGLYLLD